MPNSLRCFLEYSDWIEVSPALFLPGGTKVTDVLDPGGCPYQFGGSQPASRPISLLPSGVTVTGTLKPPWKRPLTHFDKPQPVGRPQCGAPENVVTTGTLVLCWGPPLPRQSQPISSCTHTHKGYGHTTSLVRCPVPPAPPGGPPSTGHDLEVQ